MAEGKQWRRLTAERKFRIFLEKREPEAPVGEILRRHGLTLEDLWAIEEAVESAAIAATEAIRLAQDGETRTEQAAGPISYRKAHGRRDQPET